MNEINAFISASGAIWFGLGLYLAYLAKKQAEITKRLNELEQLSRGENTNLSS